MAVIVFLAVSIVTRRWKIVAGLLLSGNLYNPIFHYSLYSTGRKEQLSGHWMAVSVKLALAKTEDLIYHGHDGGHLHDNSLHVHRSILDPRQECVIRTSLGSGCG